MTLRMAEVDKTRIRPDPDQPRREFKNLQELAGSIETHGLLQPITVMAIEGDPDADFQIIAGERRWRATCLTSLATIPCLIRDDVAAGDIFELQVLENVSREQMNSIEEAAAYQQLLDDGMKASEIEQRLGLCTGMVMWQVKVLSCRPEVQHLVARGQFNLTQATQLGKLSQDGQLVALRELNQKGLSNAAFTVLVDTIWARENQREMFAETKIDPETREKADKFRTALGRLAKDSELVASLNPDILAAAFSHELPRLEYEIEMAMKALQKAKRGIQRESGRQAAQEALI